ncbi:uncharacterized protein LOC110049176 isoform X2 [Orbicella faveolata]|uniref:uncharacterized protein LOC110049176 isoform X2 n=1 Tax=Orbicella faveolata TaxID=48498 RepID=UPI0009E26863|nr:uncharacterized protein LOC110049176 isoform X2 [Orbicella faveolata]
MNCTSRALWQEVHLAEIFFYPHKLLQNPSTFSVGYVRTSGAATKHKYLQQDLQLCKVSLLQPNFSSTCGMKQRCESAFAEDTMVSESFSREEIQKCTLYSCDSGRTSTHKATLDKISSDWNTLL